MVPPCIISASAPATSHASVSLLPIIDLESWNRPPGWEQRLDDDYVDALYGMGGVLTAVSVRNQVHDVTDGFYVRTFLSAAVESVSFLPVSQYPLDFNNRLDAQRFVLGIVTKWAQFSHNGPCYRLSLCTQSMGLSMGPLERAGSGVLSLL